MHVNEFYESKDLNLVATLTYLGFRIEALDRRHNGNAHFAFKNNKELEEAKELFWRGEIRVEPAAFAAAVKSIKARIYGER